MLKIFWHTKKVTRTWIRPRWLLDEQCHVYNGQCSTSDAQFRALCACMCVLLNVCARLRTFNLRKENKSKEGFFVGLFKRIWDNIQVCGKARNRLLGFHMRSNEMTANALCFTKKTFLHRHTGHCREHSYPLRRHGFYSGTAFCRWYHLATILHVCSQGAIDGFQKGEIGPVLPCHYWL